MKPVIGITLDWEEQGSFSERPHYALRAQYFDAVTRAGGVPLGIPYQAGHLVDYIAAIDGLLSPGGRMASPPDWYVDNPNPVPYGASPRLDFEMKLIENALKAGLPVLGICQGMQLLGGLHGCHMTPDVTSHYQTEIEHNGGETPAHKTAHSIAITPDTLLHEITGVTEMEVNTAHREGLVSATEGVVISASAPDGVIEAIEIPERGFALGVQWHPEFFIEEDGPNRRLFAALVEAAARRKRTTGIRPATSA